MNRRIFVIALIASALGFAPWANAESNRVTTVLLVRHAEKAKTDPVDPPLSDEGKARADRLASVLASAGVTTIVTSQFVRTKLTAEPLAKAKGLSPATVTLGNEPGTRELSAASIAALVAKVRENEGKVILVIGHSDSTPALIKALGGGDFTIADTEFDDLFVVSLHGSSATTIRLKY